MPNKKKITKKGLEKFLVAAEKYINEWIKYKDAVASAFDAGTEPPNPPTNPPGL